MIKLSEGEIRQRLRELNNYKNILYPMLKERSDKLRIRNRELLRENEDLKRENKQIEKLLLELEEMREMLYGRKQKERRFEKIVLPLKEKKKEKVIREAESYRRREPNPEEITGEIRHEARECPDCGSRLTEIEEHINYREDLEDLDMLLKQAKKVTKRIIESGYCASCGTRKSVIEIPEQKVVIGQNIKAMIVYLHVLLGLSYKEIEEYLKTQFNIEISEGMVSRSLEEQSDILRPYYREIYQDLQKEKGCHYDETSWKVQGGGDGNYVWVKTGVESNKVIFWFGKSRGKGVAEKLRGDENNEQIGISDDYGAYRNMFRRHQLCWAHPYRKVRDLAESNILVESTREHCNNVFKKFKEVYERAREIKKKYDSGEIAGEKLEEEINDLRGRFKKLTMSDEKDPEKLKCIRESLKTREERYFTCFEEQGIPLDNNKAERALRRVVLKRKKSFGSKSQKGANVLSILYSVVFTIYWSYPSDQFFEYYQQALNLAEK